MYIYWMLRTTFSMNQIQPKLSYHKKRTEKFDILIYWQKRPNIFLVVEIEWITDLISSILQLTQGTSKL